MNQFARNGAGRDVAPTVVKSVCHGCGKEVDDGGRCIICEEFFCAKCIEETRTSEEYFVCTACFDPRKPVTAQDVLRKGVEEDVRARVPDL